MFEDFNSVKHRFMVNNSKVYRQQFGRHYIDYDQRFKNYAFNEAKYLPSHIKLAYELNSNLCFYKEVFDGKSTHIFRGNEIRVIELFKHSQHVVNGELKIFEYYFDMSYERISEAQELSDTKMIGDLEAFGKTTWNKKNVFQIAERMFENTIKRYLEENQIVEEKVPNLIQLLKAH